MNTTLIKRRTKSLIFGNVLALAILAIPVHVFADGGYTGPSAKGGFTGPGPALMTAQEATKQEDNTWVTLKGKILNHQGGDIYTFEDASGQGFVEIDDKAWGGQKINAQDIVELLVKVDKDWGDTELDVKTVRLAK